MANCNRCKKPTSFFPINKFCKPSTMCQKCYDNTVERNTRKLNAALSKSSALPAGMGFCMRCKNLKPTSEFGINPKQRRKIERGDELSKTCAACRDYLARTTTARRHNAEKDPDIKRANLAKQRDYSRGFRIKLLNAYGPHCRCCGETTVEFLELHHVNEDGAEHRRQIGRGPEALYRWAERNGFPDTLAVTCANCHAADTYYGGCPHKKLSVLQLAVTA